MRTEKEVRDKVYEIKNNITSNIFEKNIQLGEKRK